MKITIVSSGVFGDLDAYPELEIEIFIENDFYKTYYQVRGTDGLIEVLNKFAESLKKFPFEDKTPVAFSIVHALSRLDKIKKKEPEGIVLEAHLDDNVGHVRFLVKTRDLYTRADIAFTDTVDTATLQRLSRGILSTDFTKRCSYVWESNQTD